MSQAQTKPQPVITPERKRSHQITWTNCMLTILVVLELIRFLYGF